TCARHCAHHMSVTFRRCFITRRSSVLIEISIVRVVFLFMGFLCALCGNKFVTTEDTEVERDRSELMLLLDPQHHARREAEVALPLPAKMRRIVIELKRPHRKVLAHGDVHAAA